MIKESIGLWVYPAAAFNASHYLYLDMRSTEASTDKISELTHMLPDNYLIGEAY